MDDVFSSRFFSCEQILADSKVIAYRFVLDVVSVVSSIWYLHCVCFGHVLLRCDIIVLLLWVIKMLLGVTIFCTNGERDDKQLLSYLRTKSNIVDFVDKYTPYFRSECISGVQKDCVVIGLSILGCLLSFYTSCLFVFGLGIGFKILYGLNIFNVIVFYGAVIELVVYYWSLDYGIQETYGKHLHFGETKCPVCWKDYENVAASDIMILQCGHSLDISCFKRMKNEILNDKGSNSFLACPVCKHHSFIWFLGDVSKDTIGKHSEEIEKLARDATWLSRWRIQIVYVRFYLAGVNITGWRKRC